MLALCDKPELVADIECAVGENPLWHVAERKLLWTDITGGALFRFGPEHSTHERIYSGRPVGGFTVQHDGSLLLFKDRGTITRWNRGAEVIVVPEIPASGNFVSMMRLPTLWAVYSAAPIPKGTKAGCTGWTPMEPSP